MKDDIYRNIKLNWHLVHPVNKLFTNIDYFMENTARGISSLKKHHKTFAALITGMVLYDVISRILASISDKLRFNFQLGGNINNLILFIDICLFFALLYFISQPKHQESGKRHWYE